MVFSLFFINRKIIFFQIGAYLITNIIELVFSSNANRKYKTLKYFCLVYVEVGKLAKKISQLCHFHTPMLN
jgi:hypothetical protein